MRSVIHTLLDRMNDQQVKKCRLINWGSPIQSFGNFKNSTIATLGLNPSNCEFVDDRGNELCDDQRRFHSLKSLELKKWSDAGPYHVREIENLSNQYFLRNPYDRWFKRLEYIISSTGASFYGEKAKACHLDLVPYATECKWTELTSPQRSVLLDSTKDILGKMVSSSNIRILILNGMTVIENLRKISNIEFDIEPVKAWTLPRLSGPGVGGNSYKGVISSIGGISLKKDIVVLGYNHNIQSSFGVTNKVQTSIKEWVAEESNGFSV